jgi:hypothetical protein
MRRAALLGVAVLCLAGCGGGEPEDEGSAQGDAARSEDEEVIRGWSAAVNRGDYDRAADLFAEGAVVEQVTEIRLDTHAEAVAFNRGLPCRADVTDVDAEGNSALAAFDLREGRTGECTEGGSARVRFVISDGQIEEWRQLPPQPVPEGDTA